MNIKFHATAFSQDDADFLRKNGIGLEIGQYANPAFLDDFDAKHPLITGLMQGMSGVSMHGAYYDIFYTSIDPLIVEVTKKRFLQSIRAASFHGIDCLTFHSVYRPQFDGHSEAWTDAFIKKSVGFWKDFEANIPDGMTVCIENVDDEDPEVFMEVIRGIGSPKIRACFDIGHANISSRVPLETWARVLGDSIAHVHIHDNDGKKDLHLPLGHGVIPLSDVVRSVLEYTGNVVFAMECSAGLSMDWIRENGAA